MPPAPQTVSTTISPEKTVTTTNDNGAKFFEWVGLLFLALSVWIWRGELKLTGFGPFSGTPLEQQTPEDFQKDKTDDEMVAETVTISPQPSRHIQPTEPVVPSGVRPELPSGTSMVVGFEEHRDTIMQMFRENHAVTPDTLGKELGVAPNTASIYLDVLTREGKVRCDGYPNKSLYTSTSSLENLAIDRVRDLIEEQVTVTWERRFVRVGRRPGYELDAVFKTAQLITFLVEVKHLKDSRLSKHHTDVIMRLARLAKEFQKKSKEVICYLVLVALDDSFLAPLTKQINSFTFDTGDVETRIILLSKNELEGKVRDADYHRFPS